jgi:hypothetical protein
MFSIRRLKASSLARGCGGGVGRYSGHVAPSACHALPQGRGAGVGRGRGVGVHLPVHGVAVAVGLAVGVGVGVSPCTYLTVA